jgi:MtN3 and saliva related transmembrane protein
MGYQLQLLDPNVSTATNVFLIIANVINLVYNIPQVVKTYKTRSTRDFSATFLFLRIAGNIIWVAYSIEVESLMLLINNVVTVLASTFIAYYKVSELLSKNAYEPALLTASTEESEL